MRVVMESVEETLVEAVYRLRNMPVSWCALHFHLSGLQPESRTPAKQELTLTALQDALDTNNPAAANKHEGIFICHDQDMIVLCCQRTQATIDQAINALRFFFTDDPKLADHDVPVDALCTVYDLTQQYEDLFFVCTQKQYGASQIRKRSASASAAGSAIADLPFSFALKRRETRTTPVVMVVDDDRFTLELLAKMLNRKYEVHKAKNGIEAIQKYQDEAPDIVFLDIELPDTSGHKVLDNIIAVDPQAFVVMLSAHSQMDNVRKAVNNGAKGFVAKPFNQLKIESYVQICLVEKEEIKRAAVA